MTGSTKDTSLQGMDADRNTWRWGFTPQAEIWNGRFAMIGFIAALMTEYFSGQGVLHFWGLMNYAGSAR